MHRGESLDEFFEWVCSTGESVRTAGERLAKERKWGVASMCWEAKLRRIQEDFDKLKLEVSRCVTTRDANRLLLDREAGISESLQPRPTRHFHSKSKVVRLFRAGARSSAS